MGGNESISVKHATDLLFLADNNKENFLNTLNQVSKQSCNTLNEKSLSDILGQNKDVNNFLLVTSGPNMTKARMWQTQKIFVCQITTPIPPIPLYTYTYHQYKGLPFMSIHLDQSSFNHMNFFMNRVMNFIERREFLSRIVQCIETRDTQAIDMISPFSRQPIEHPPKLMISIPYNARINRADQAPLDNSMYTFTSEIEPNDESSQFPIISEPNEENSFTSYSSVAGLISEPGSSQRFSSCSSVMKPISEPSSIDGSGIDSDLSSVLAAISEPEDIDDSDTSSLSSNYGIISEPSSEANSSELSSQYGLISEPESMYNSSVCESIASSVAPPISEPSDMDLSDNDSIVSAKEVRKPKIAPRNDDDSDMSSALEMVIDENLQNSQNRRRPVRKTKAKNTRQK